MGRLSTTECTYLPTLVAREFVMCVVVGVHLQAAGVDWTLDPMAIPVIETSKSLNCPRTW